MTNIFNQWKQYEKDVSMSDDDRHSPFGRYAEGKKKSKLKIYQDLCPRKQFKCSNLDAKILSYAQFKISLTTVLQSLLLSPQFHGPSHSTLVTLYAILLCISNKMLLDP